MSTSQFDLIVNQIKLLPPDDLVKLIRQMAEILEQKWKMVSDVPDAEGIDLQSRGIDQTQAAGALILPLLKIGTIRRWTFTTIMRPQNYERRRVF